MPTYLLLFTFLVESSRYFANQGSCGSECIIHVALIVPWDGLFIYLFLHWNKFFIPKFRGKFLSEFYVRIQELCHPGICGNKYWLIYLFLYSFIQVVHVQNFELNFPEDFPSEFKDYAIQEFVVINTSST